MKNSENTQSWSNQFWIPLKRFRDTANGRKFQQKTRNIDKKLIPINRGNYTHQDDEVNEKL